MDLFREKHTSQTLCRPYEKARFQLIWENGQGFPEIEQPSFMVGLRTIMALVDVSFSRLVYYNKHMMRLKVYWKSILLPSQTQLVQTSLCMSYGQVILLKVVPCPLLSCFIPSEILLPYFYGKKKGDGRSVFCNCFKTE